jgi:hypothetical protein
MKNISIRHPGVMMNRRIEPGDIGHTVEAKVFNRQDKIVSTSVGVLSAYVDTKETISIFFKHCRIPVSFDTKLFYVRITRHPIFGGTEGVPFIK